MIRQKSEMNNHKIQLLGMHQSGGRPSQPGGRPSQQGCRPSRQGCDLRQKGRSSTFPKGL